MQFVCALWCLSFAIQSSNSQKTCDNAYQCVGQSIVETGDSYESRGYQSNAGVASSISTGSKLLTCSGSLSCSQTSYIHSGGPFCTGTKSCENISDIRGGAYVHGSGVNAFSHSNITLTYAIKMYCAGYGSCSHSIITDAANLYASGAFSLYHATIINPENVYFGGFMSGYQATIICEESKTCNIECYDNCLDTTFNCSGICNIVSDNVTATMVQVSMFNNFTTIATLNDEVCSNQPPNMRFDNWLDYTQRTFDIDYTSGGPVCCRGMWGCPYNIIYNKSVICSGAESCTGITSASKLYCEGSDSCQYAYINSSIVYCLGSASCAGGIFGDTIIQASELYCLGGYSCYKSNSSFNSNDSIAYLLGEQAGREGTFTFYNTGTIKCLGYNACKKTIVNCVGKCNIYCDATHACNDLSIICNDDCDIHCVGRESCNATTVNCYGYCNAICDDHTLCPKIISNSPTEQPTPPTQLPTNAPSNSPTKQPTEPTTAAPTTLTNYPTSSPTLSPTEAPTFSPIYLDTIDTSYETATLNATIILVMVVIVIPVIITIFACIFHRKRRGSDYPSYIAIFKCFGNVSDFYTDIWWGLILMDEGHYLGIYAISFAVGSHILAIIIGCIFIIKWRQSEKNVHLSGYANRYDKFILFGSVIAGFYTTIDIITSHLFHLNISSLQLTHKQLSQLKTFKIIHTMSLEHIPVFIMQCIYLSSTIDVTNLNVTLLTMAFSITAIAFNLFILIEKCGNRIIPQISKKNNVTGNVSIAIKYEIKQCETGIISNHHLHTHYLLNRATSNAFKLLIYQIDTQYINKVTDGIQINAYLKKLDTKNAQSIINDINDGQSDMFKNWEKEICHHLKVITGKIEVNVLDITTDETVTEMTLNRILSNELE